MTDQCHHQDQNGNEKMPALPQYGAQLGDFIRSHGEVFFTCLDMDEAKDAEVVEKNATRINQLSLMIADYARTDTSKFDVKTEALAKIWQDPEHFSKDINKLTLASATLITAAQSNDESAIKKAIGGVGKTCGGCHDHFKKD